MGVDVQSLTPQGICHTPAMNRKEIIALCALVGGQVGLARIIGVDPRTVRRWVAGDTKPVGLARAALGMIGKTKEK